MTHRKNANDNWTENVMEREREREKINKNRAKRTNRDSFGNGQFS